MEVIKSFAKYLWPEGAWDVKTRVVVSLGLLIGSKVISHSLSHPFSKHLRSLG